MRQSEYRPIWSVTNQFGLAQEICVPSVRSVARRTAMPRQTKSEIDDEILDCAAGLFARHGFTRTSIQQIAEALKYSKAGLLHHYSSKQALFDAVMVKHQAQTSERLDHVRTFAPGIVRDRELVEGAVDFAYQWPGMAEFGHYLSREQIGDNPRLAKLGLDLLEVMGIDLTAPDMQRLTRAFTALAGANFTARMAVKMGLQKEWRDMIIASAMDALGHPRAADD
jgi:AcrR family transcriptional regulator